MEMYGKGGMDVGVMNIVLNRLNSSTSSISNLTSSPSSPPPFSSSSVSSVSSGFYLERIPYVTIGSILLALYILQCRSYYIENQYSKIPIIKLRIFILLGLSISTQFIFSFDTSNATLGIGIIFFEQTVLWMFQIVIQFYISIMTLVQLHMHTNSNVMKYSNCMIVVHFVFQVYVLIIDTLSAVYGLRLYRFLSEICFAVFLVGQLACQFASFITLRRMITHVVSDLQIKQDDNDNITMNNTKKNSIIANINNSNNSSNNNSNDNIIINGDSRRSTANISRRSTAEPSTIETKQNRRIITIKPSSSSPSIVPVKQQTPESIHAQLVLPITVTTDTNESVEYNRPVLMTIDVARASSDSSSDDAVLSPNSLTVPVSSPSSPISSPLSPLKLISVIKLDTLTVQPRNNSNTFLRPMLDRVNSASMSGLSSSSSMGTASASGLLSSSSTALTASSSSPPSSTPQSPRGLPRLSRRRSSFSPSISIPSSPFNTSSFFISTMNRLIYIQLILTVLCIAGLYFTIQYLTEVHDDFLSIYVVDNSSYHFSPLTPLVYVAVCAVLAYVWLPVNNRRSLHVSIVQPTSKFERIVPHHSPRLSGRFD